MSECEIMVVALDGDQAGRRVKSQKKQKKCNDQRARSLDIT